MSRTAFRQFIAEESSRLPRPPPPPLPPLAPPPPQSVVAPAPVSGKPLPDFRFASHIRPETIVKPDLLINGLLHRGCKLMLSGGSKSFKSWVLIDLAVCLASGLPWWGLECRPGRVLYLNFELIDGFFEDRVLSVCRARNVAPPQSFLYWNLRGHCYDLAVLAQVILARIKDFGPFDLIVGDPMYKMLGDLDENKASDMTKMMNLIESVSTQTGAATAFGSHFAKGNASGKEMKDRASGSGVLSRDPDALIALTRHEVDGAYSVETELRYLPQLAPFVVRWNFPLMNLDESLDPRKLYVPGAESSAQTPQAPGFSEQDVLDCLPVGGAQDTLWRKHVSEKFHRTGDAYYAAKASLIRNGLVVKRGLLYFRTQLKFEK